MPDSLETISREALVLPPDQRVALAHRLLASVEPAPESGTEAAWGTEIRRRIAQFDAGESQPIPAGEVFARLVQIAPGR